MTDEELLTNEDLNKFYRSLIAFQATALDYIAAGEEMEDKINRAITATGFIDQAKQSMFIGGCTNCGEDEVCCNDGSCALPGLCPIPHLAEAQLAVKTETRRAPRP